MSFNIIGTGRSVPEYILTNDELSTMVETNDEWIVKRTGIKERRICTTETLNDLCVNSARQAMEQAGVTAQELDLIIVATITAQYFTPSQACIVQSLLGATCPAFDVNAACSGFIYALDVADGYFARNKAEKILVIAADNLSNIVDWEDRSTCVLFGDAAGAVVLSKGDSLKSIKLTAKGNVDALFAPKGENTSPFYKHEKYRKPVLNMDGHEVYKFAVSSMVKEIKAVIEMAGLTQDYIDFVVPHQANIRIIDAAIAKLDIPAEKYVKNLQSFGNTSASCMPVALDIANRNGLFKKGDIICMCAFGAGLTTGSCVLEWK
ncbi:MAG: beta-ketoacyl-ACP synthase III [Acutalibacteraceae bacterium]